MRAKIPVVIMDSGLKSDNYVSFVATDNFKGGQLGAEHLGKLLGGKGKVILLRYAVGSAIAIALLGCSCTRTPPGPNYSDVDEARMSVIEDHAARNGVRVYWINPPRKSAAGG